MMRALHRSSVTTTAPGLQITTNGTNTRFMVWYRKIIDIGITKQIATIISIRMTIKEINFINRCKAWPRHKDRCAPSSHVLRAYDFVRACQPNIFLQNIQTCDMLAQTGLCADDNSVCSELCKRNGNVGT